MRIINNLQNWLAKLTWQQSLHVILALFMMALLAVFFDWLIINWLSGCCNGGECIPAWVYPQCQMHGGRHD